MLSKQSYLNDGVKGPWRPHVMPFVALDQVATWGAGFDGSKVSGDGKADGSRLAAASDTSTTSPASMTWPATSTVCVATRDSES